MKRALKKIISTASLAALLNLNSCGFPEDGPFFNFDKSGLECQNTENLICGKDGNLHYQSTCNDIFGNPVASEEIAEECGNNQYCKVGTDEELDSCSECEIISTFQCGDINGDNINDVYITNNDICNNDITTEEFDKCDSIGERCVQHTEDFASCNDCEDLGNTTCYNGNEVWYVNSCEKVSGLKEICDNGTICIDDDQGTATCECYMPENPETVCNEDDLSHSYLADSCGNPIIIDESCPENTQCVENILGDGSCQCYIPEDVAVVCNENDLSHSYSEDSCGNPLVQNEDCESQNKKCVEENGIGSCECYMPDNPKTTCDASDLNNTYLADSCGNPVQINEDCVTQNKKCIEDLLGNGSCECYMPDTPNTTCDASDLDNTYLSDSCGNPVQINEDCLSQNKECRDGSCECYVPENPTSTCNSLTNGIHQLDSCGMLVNPAVEACDNSNYESCTEENGFPECKSLAVCINTNLYQTEISLNINYTNCETLCQNSTILEYDDWHVPSMNETRMTVDASKCSDIATGGACNISEDATPIGCQADSCYSDVVDYCLNNSCPIQTSGNYLVDGFSTSVGKIWTTLSNQDRSGYQFYLNGNDGQIVSTHENNVNGMSCMCISKNKCTD